jgi:hypothetical protein
MNPDSEATFRNPVGDAVPACVDEVRCKTGIHEKANKQSQGENTETPARRRPACVVRAEQIVQGNLRAATFVPSPDAALGDGAARESARGRFHDTAKTPPTHRFPRSKKI